MPADRTTMEKTAGALYSREGEDASSGEYLGAMSLRKRVLGVGLCTVFTLAKPLPQSRASDERAYGGRTQNLVIIDLSSKSNLSSMSNSV